MSANMNPREILQSLWKPLCFAQVRAVKTDPKNIVSAALKNNDPCAHTQYIRPDEIRNYKPADLDISYPFYYGFARTLPVANRPIREVYFNRDGYNELDCDINLTLQFGTLLNHLGGHEPPGYCDLLCGTIVHKEKGDAFRSWFNSTPQFHALWHLIMFGEQHPIFRGKTREQILNQLITRPDLKDLRISAAITKGSCRREEPPKKETAGSSWCDIYVAIAKLIYYGESDFTGLGLPSGEYKTEFERMSFADTVLRRLASDFERRSFADTVLRRLTAT
jgi:hypothetical protein